MKLNKYFMIGAMGLSLVACSDNLDENGQGANGTNPNEGTTYVAFGLDFKAAGSRAEVGDTWESDVNSAYVIMDNSVIISMDNTDTEADAGYYDAASEKFLFHTEPGEHTFLAVINPETPPSTENLDDYFTESVKTTPTVVANITEEGQTKKGNFMMSSVEEKTFYINDNVTEERALQGTDESTNSYKIEVERVSAKVTVTAADATIESAEGTEAGGEIDETKTVFNLLQGADKMTRMAGDILASNTYTWEVENVAVGFGSTTPYKTAAPAYCLENIHETYVQDETTYITLKTVFTPSKVVNAQGTLEDYTGEKGKTFFVVTEGTEGLVGNYIMAGEDGNAPNPLPNGVTAVSAPYNNGECWFGPIWFGQAEGQLGESGEAPVVRNTWYNLQITSIKLPGSPDKPRPIPDEKLEPATNVAITLEIMPWNFVSHSVVLQ